VFRELRKIAGDGLFTASDEEENWGIAHRILLPEFSQKALKAQIPEMVNQAIKLVKQFEKFKTTDDIDILSWMTKVTIDSISVCGFGYDFGSIDSESDHPFVTNLGVGLEMVLKEAVRPGLVKAFHKKDQEIFSEAVAYMKSFCIDIIKKRQELYATEGDDSKRSKDFLDLMLKAEDPQTKKGMSDDSIVNNLITFLIAGHDTTASLMSWVFYLLCINPHVMQKVKNEVELVCGKSLRTTNRITQVEVSKLKYCLQVIKEGLRLYPSVGSWFKVALKEDTLCGFPVHAGQRIIFPNLGVNMNRIYWGDQADEFNPDNFSPEAEAKRHPHAYSSFGSGPRACLGAQFALIEARIILAYVIFNFDITLAPKCNPKLIQKTALKPDDLYLRFFKHQSPIPDIIEVPPTPISESVPQSEKLLRKEYKQHKVDGTFQSGGVPEICIAYAGNMGTSKGLAINLVNALKRARLPVNMIELDELPPLIEKTSLLIIISSTYNGLPPDNGRKFDNWLDSEKASIKNLRYLVFGVGNTLWKTFQYFPIKIDEGLEKLGGIRLLERCSGNVDDGYDIDQTFEEWKSELFKMFKKVYGYKPVLSKSASELEFMLLQDIKLEKCTGKAEIPDLNVSHHTVKDVIELQHKDSGRKTKHIVLDCKETFKAGDHFAVYPQNSDADIESCKDIIKFEDFGLDLPFKIRIEDSSGILPANATSARLLLKHYLDLHAVPTRKVIIHLATYTNCPPERDEILNLSSEKYLSHVLNVRRSFLWFFSKFRSLSIPFTHIIRVVPSLQPRLYSISNSPNLFPHEVHLTVSVLDSASRHLDIEKENYIGFCSNYLAKLNPGDHVHGNVKDHNSKFTLPIDHSLPVIMVSAGSGIAPFRGFLQEREYQMSKGVLVGPSVLIFGCRRSDHDELYKDEISNYKSLTRKYVAYSKDPSSSKTYVQEKMLQDECKDEIWKNINEKKGAFYVCGEASGMAQGVRESLMRIIQEKMAVDEPTAQNQLQKFINNEQYVVDVWGK
jgi:cytochrome P450/NADPH-cytochrome P450 reductase